jgi:hypothetical protein
MKIIILLSVILTACAPALHVKSFLPESGQACKSPLFVKTATKSTANSGVDLSLYQLTKDAQSAIGPDVSIQNVHWDTQGGVRVSVIYDIIKCGQDTARIQ